MRGPVPITVGICCLGYAALSAHTRLGSAVSAEARAVTRAASDIVRSAEDSQALFGGRAAAISRLGELVDQCSREGWDGADAYALDAEALENAADFIRALPDGIPMPEFAPEPDGSVSLDWIQSRHRLFSVSVGRGNRLAYAWLDGADTGHGVARFDGVNVPARVLAGIQSIQSDENASFRTT